MAQAPDPHRPLRFVAAAVLMAAAVVLSPPGAEPAGWLPATSPFPRYLADPLEPRTGVVYAPDPDRMDMAVGLPVPIVAFGAFRREITAVLEVGTFFRVGKTGTFFPLQTTEGLIRAGFETAWDPLVARLRLSHISAHRADGDPSVAYRGQTYSREFWTLEAGWRAQGLFLYLGGGTSWHAIPEDDGFHVSLGAQGTGKGTWRPYAAIHLAGDAERGWRFNQSLAAGVETGRERAMRAGIRYYNGNSPRGQFWTTPEQYLGLEVQYGRPGGS